MQRVPVFPLNNYGIAVAFKPIMTFGLFKVIAYHLVNHLVALTRARLFKGNEDVDCRLVREVEFRMSLRVNAELWMAGGEQVVDDGRADYARMAYHVYYGKICQFNIIS